LIFEPELPEYETGRFLFDFLGYITLNDGLAVNNLCETVLKTAAIVYHEVMFPTSLYGKIKGTKCQGPFSRPRLKPETSPIQSKIASHPYLTMSY
jgi:hypothetical protein